MLAQRRNQERPLPFGTGHIEAGADKEDCSWALHVRQMDAASVAPGAWPYDTTAFYAK